MTPAVKVLLIANAAVYILQLILDPLTGNVFSSSLALYFETLKRGYIWQFFTYMFLHGGPFHLFFNLLVLFFIGPETERTVGTRSFYGLYIISGMLAGLGWLVVNPESICVGASGAVFGILGAFAALYPNREIMLLLFFVLPIKMKAWVMVAGLVFIEFVLMLEQGGGVIAHSVHLAGALAGFVFIKTFFKKTGIGFASLRRKPKMRVLHGYKGGVKPSQGEVDRVLEKVAREGVQSLSHRERAILDAASRDLNTRS